MISPALRSASIAICLPGIASSVKRAPTSATRPAPLVTTTNWITIRIRKITRPTITLPPTTNSPNAFTTLPASPVVRISRVTETLIASRNIVVSSSRLGNEAKSSALPRYIVAATIVSAAEMLIVISRSSTAAGSGTTSIVTTSTTATAASMSV